MVRGLNFAPAPKRIPVPETIAAVESGLSRVCPSDAQLRTRIAGYLAKSKPPSTNLSPGHQSTQRSRNL